MNSKLFEYHLNTLQPQVPGSQAWVGVLRTLHAGVIDSSRPAAGASGARWVPMG